MSQTTGSEWTLLDEEGGTAVTFTSFIDIDIDNSGKALSYPVEEGSFANYNKTQTPIDMRVTLATQGDADIFADVLLKLDELQINAVKITVATPSIYYDNMTLESHSYKQARDAGAGLLVVELHLVEVREVQTQTTTTVISKPKNPSSASKVNTGKTQTQTQTQGAQGNNRSALSELLN